MGTVSERKKGSPGRTRTSDHSINSRALYQLSYRGTTRVGTIQLRGAQFRSANDGL